MLQKIVLLTTFLPFVFSSKAPKDWTFCKKNDPNINECSLKAIEYAVNSLMKGNRQLGVVPMDPLHIDRLSLDQSKSNSPVGINLTLTDFDVKGLSGMKLTKADIKWDKPELKVTMQTKDVNLKGKYKATGKVLILPFVGDGDFELFLENFSADGILTGKYEKKNGKTYFRPEDFKMKLYTTRMKMNFENLFNGDKALGETTNKFINENWKDILEELQGSLSKGFGAVFTSISQIVFSKIPMEEVTPSN